MTEESDGLSNAPGSGAGDAAPTQAIPRISNPAAKRVPGKKPVVKKPPVAKPDHGSTTDATTDPTTDKGRPRDIAAPPKVVPSESAPAATAAPTAAPAKKRQIEPVGGPTGRTLTASDYARTTKPSAATTSVIPAVKDRPGTDHPKGESGDRSSKASGSAAAVGVSGRRASLRLTHVDPWSVTRLAFAISVAMMIVATVAVAVFWVVLNVAGVWDQINDSFTSVLSDNSSSFNVNDYFGFGRMVGLALVLSAVNVVLMTALATIGAHLYNLSSQLMGGVEVTFTEQN